MSIIDLHCDVLSKIYATKQSLWSNDAHFDVKRALESRVIIQFMALFVEPDWKHQGFYEILKQINYYHQQLEILDQHLYHISSEADIRAECEKKIGCILHLEGAHALGDDVELLEILYRLGLRSLGITWNNRNLFADGIGEGLKAGGLSQKGRQLVAEINRLGIMLDLSHLSMQGFFEVLEITDRPVIVSHANARQLCSHPRNLDDTQLSSLAANGGIIGINQVSYFVSEQGQPSIDQVVDHIVYIADKIGVKHIALGSDFDGADDIVMQGIQEYSAWNHVLRQRRFTDQEINMILCGNALRIIKQLL